jgi:tetratricopeptide (TPR) repeat protein
LPNVTINPSPTLRPAKLLPWVLLVVTVLAYHNSVRGVFVFDDAPRIEYNQRLRNPGPLTDWLGMSRPVVESSLLLNYVIGEQLHAMRWGTGGLDPRGYHIFNLAVHVLVGLTLYGIMWRTLSLPGMSDRVRGAARALAFSVALIWAAHPLTTQAVTYVIQRSESMMAMFYLAVIYAALRAATYQQQGASGRSARVVFWSIAAVVFCLLGMGSKQVMVSSPILVLLFDRTFLADSFKQALSRRWGLYVALFGTWLALASTMGFGAVLFSETSKAGFSFKAVTPWEYFRTQPSVILLEYLRLALWPRPLCFDYLALPLNNVFQIAWTMAALSLLGILTLWAVIRRSWIGVVGAAFFLVLGPTSSFIPIQDMCVEHRMYLPLAAVVIAVVIGAFGLLSRMSVDGSGSRRVMRGALTLAVMLAVVLAIRTYQRNMDYHSRVEIWGSVIEVRPKNWRARGEYGRVLWHDADELQEALPYLEAAAKYLRVYDKAQFNYGAALVAADKPDEALYYLDRTVEIKPDFEPVYYELGRAHRALGNAEKAITYFRKAIELDPERRSAWADLAGVLFEQGQEHNTGQTDEAVDIMLKLTFDHPTYIRGMVNLALMFEKLDRREESLALYKEALAVEPDNPSILFKVGDVLARDGDYERAIPYFEKAMDQKAMERESKFTEARQSLAKACAAVGRHGDALIHYLIVIDAKPDDATLHNAIGIEYARTGRRQQALESFARTVELDDQFAEGHLNLARAQTAARRLDLAIQSMQRAIELAREQGAPDKVERWTEALEHIRKQQTTASQPAEVANESAKTD